MKWKGYGRPRSAKALLLVITAEVVASVALGGAVWTGVASTQRGVSFAALGDSYSAGNGTEGSSGRCDRSEAAYGPLTASEEGYDIQDSAQFAHMACSMDTTQDVAEDQLEVLGPDTERVTLTAGGNDGDMFLTTVLACAVNPVEKICGAVQSRAVEFASDELPGRLRSLYRDIAARTGEDTRVTAGGYPLPYGKTSRCTWPVPPGNREKANELAGAVNDAIRNEVARMGARWTYVDPDFTGHELCTRDPWMWDMGKAATDLEAAFHPNDAGHRRYAERIRQAAGKHIPLGT